MTIDNKIALCIDIGGTHISGALINAHQMTLLQEDSYINGPVDSNADKSKILKSWESVILQLIENSNSAIQNIFVSIPGPFDYENGICLMDGMHKYQSLLHMNVKEYLSQLTKVPIENILFYNDAQAFLLGEVYANNWKDKTIVGLTLGTGLGSALYQHNTVEDLNYGSSPFKEGISEDYISTRGIIGFMKTQSSLQYANVLEIINDSHNTNSKVVAMEYLSNNLVQFINQHISKIKPDYIVLGGSIAKSHTLFIDAVQSEIELPIKPASFNELNLFFGMISSTI